MTLRIEKEGQFTSIQDLGQHGLQRFGVNPRGAMDPTAVRLINILLGNREDYPVLEFHFPGPEIVFEEECAFALGGADFNAVLDGEPAANWRTHVARRSSLLRFSRKALGNRCYLAAGGGLRQADDIAGHGVNRFYTERIQKGEKLVRMIDSQKSLPSAMNRILSPAMVPNYRASPTVRIVSGPEFDELSYEHRKLLEAANFTISKESNRMGFRLNGPELRTSRPLELVSATVSFGTIQLLPDGQLIVLMADHQVSGGYPRIGQVISADLSLVGQLGPGDRIAFELVGIPAAERALGKIESDLKKLAAAVNFGRYP